MSPKQEAGKNSSDDADEGLDKLMMRKLFIEKQRTRRQLKNGHNPFRNKCVRPKKVSIGYSSSQCKQLIGTLKMTPNEVSKTDAKLISDITEGIAQIWNNTGYREASSRGSTKSSGSKRKSKQSKDDSLILSPESTTSQDTESSACPKQQSCAQQALNDYFDSSVTELAAYLDETLYIPRKMSFMAEMMYT